MDLEDAEKALERSKIRESAIEQQIDGRFGTEIQVAAHSAIITGGRRSIQVMTQICLEDLPVRTLASVMEAFGYNVAKHLLIRLSEGGWTQKINDRYFGIPLPPKPIELRDIRLYHNLVASGQEPAVPQRDQKPPFAPE